MPAKTTTKAEKAAKTEKAGKAGKAPTRKRKRKFHPIADLFPMLLDAELHELAEDIRANGLLSPIVLDGEGRVLDGRNRLNACELAGVEPQFTTYEGESPEQYALSVNIARRHLTKGQIAVIALQAEAVCDKPLSVIAARSGASKARIAYAKTVLDFAPDLVAAVVGGARSLDDAYTEARQRKIEQKNEEQKLGDLRERAPDLADRVVEENLKLSEAIAIQRQQQEEHEGIIRREVDRLGQLLIGWLTMGSLPSNPDRDEILRELSENDRTQVEEIEALLPEGGVRP